LERIPFIDCQKKYKKSSILNSKERDALNDFKKPPPKCLDLLPDITIIWKKCVEVGISEYIPTT
jgi:hypothetical protein